MPRKMTYRGVGVKYEEMDPFKIEAQISAEEIAVNLQRFGFEEVEESRGESVYLFETEDAYWAHVHEGLGTKNLVADAMFSSRKTYYNQIAQDTVAMIVNDMITLGASPLSIAMHLAVGDSNWFKKKKRASDLIKGWKDACNLARCVWAGGETSTLKDIVNPETVELSGSGIGIIRSKERLIKGNIQHGDDIVLLASSGIHANGLTLARKIAEKLPQGFRTKMSDGRMYGEALLDPTIIYVPIVEDCLEQGVEIHYAVNITGHGWRKLMRAPEPFEYIIKSILPIRTFPVFQFILEQGPVDLKEAFATFNMGAGFALYISSYAAERVVSIALKHQVEAFHAGYIEKSSKKKVHIQPWNLVYEEESLDIR